MNENIIILNKIKNKLRNINLSKIYEKIDFLTLKNMMNEKDNNSRYYSDDKNIDDNIPYVEIGDDFKKYYDCSLYSSKELEELKEIDILNKLNRLIKTNKRDYKRNGY